MRRREFLRAAGVGAAAAAIAKPAIAQSAPELKWRLTSSFPKSLDTIYGAAEMFAKAVAEATDNRFQIQVFAAGEIVPGLQALDAVSDGTVEMCHTASYYYVGKDPTFAFGTAVPFGLNAAHAARLDVPRRRRRAVQRVLQEVQRHRHCRPAIPARRWAAGSARRSRTVADLNGLKMRIGGFAGRVLAKVGVVPQQLAGGDIYPALEKGTHRRRPNGSGPTTTRSSASTRSRRTTTTRAGGKAARCCTTSSISAKWDELPQVLPVRRPCGVARTPTRWMQARYDAQNPAALKRLVAAGAQLRPFPPAVMDACFKAANELYAETAAANAEFKKVYESTVAFRSDQYLWWQVAEYGFDTFMIRSRTRA